MTRRLCQSFILAAVLVLGLGSALAKDTLRPLVVTISETSNCPWSDYVRRELKEPKKVFASRVQFSELDPSKPDAKQKAKDLGIDRYYADAADHAPMVMIFTDDRKLLKELVGPKTADEYKKQIESALAQSK